MTETQTEHEQIRRPRRFHYLIDIIVLVAVTLLLDVAVGSLVNVPGNLQIGFVFDALGKVLLIVVACGLIWLRGERLADIGLKRPENWWRTMLIGVVYAI